MLLWFFLSLLMVVSTLAAPKNPIKRSSVLDKMILDGFSDEQKTQVEDAFRDVMTLANAVIEGAGETETTKKAAFKSIYLKYFPESEYEVVMTIFNKITGGAETQYTGNTMLENVPINSESSSDYGFICEDDEKVEALMVTLLEDSDSEVVICSRALRLGGIGKGYNKDTKAVTCDEFKGNLEDALPLGTVLLHEFMHWEHLVSPPLDRKVVDLKYGPWSCQHALNKAHAIYNADSYTWFASER
ncbi:hypothetical protein N7495_010066 [Penicillium taxi]|uniref:uncharacterized protein n=1 Tax=Penicillium taxi TaxID=168475 RepID=UPI002544E511|nr:uncharacterized protein N7495_010066 [Penicillium taxi]KAJ5885556.1 hypothetical protein N7495_010066 [Penicillium taxi]